MNGFGMIDEVAIARVLSDLAILDTAPDPEFDAVVALAKSMFSTPVALISLMDGSRQWFKAVDGIELHETPRSISFCDHVVRTGQPMIIPDASRDQRFADNPLVTAAPFIRFYAGVPLKVGDVDVGSLCVFDSAPRAFSDDHTAVLRRFGDLAERMLEQYQASRRVSALNERLSSKRDRLAAMAGELELKSKFLTEACSVARVGAWERDTVSGVRRWSEEMYLLHDVPPDFVPSDENLADFYLPADRERFAQLMEESDRTKRAFTFEAQMVTPKGNRRFVRINSHLETGEKGASRRYGTVQDITAERERSDRIRKLAETDDLTKLRNRGFFLDSLERGARLASDGGAPLALLLLDLDAFKALNDAHGHLAGDHCLRTIGERLASLSSDRVLAGRLGGDEFAVLVKDGDETEIQAVAGAIWESVQQPIEWEGTTFELGTSIGLTVQNGAATAETLLLEADLALYAAKDAGRNRILRFEEPMRESANKHSVVLSNMRRALRQEELELYFQPKIDLASGAHKGFEALLRWNAPDGRVVAPGEFAEALVDPKLGPMIGDFVVASAADQARRWDDAGIGFGSIAVNLSAAQFRHSGSIDVILDTMRSRGLKPGMIEIEVTEGVFLSGSTERALESCRRLRAAGIRVAFDDFGTGFASLTHLVDFPVDVIKIDRSFVSELGIKDSMGAVVEGIVTMCRALSKEVVAEGVETAEQARFLRSVGCSMAQGYLYARPLPSLQAEQWVADRANGRAAA